ncbi:hypothetical protein EVAR_78127_1 [Eumeta japonica]|uniref:Uncharacterized protein n=1 Tax=Eumeta variegata TaxID=151549 RepID=A0A4C1T1J9_EUMVA|nr:hypothetical protein EVAR_78127_1 [Eumeta japonica]
MGKYGYGVCNKRGQRLLSYGYQYKFSVMNSFFKKKESRRWTWISPNQKTCNEIDFIMTNHHKLMTNVEILSKGVTEIELAHDLRMPAVSDLHFRALGTAQWRQILFITLLLASLCKFTCGRDTLCSNLPQHENGPARAMRCHTLSEYRREVTASAIAFRASESSGGSLSFVAPLPQHRIFYSHLRVQQCITNSFGIANVHGR